MKNTFITLLCWLVLYTGAGSLLAQSAVHMAVLQSEDRRFGAQVARDTAALQTLLADDLVYIHSNALVEDKAAFLRSVAGGGIQYHRMQSQSDRRVRRYGRIQLVNGVVDVAGLYQGTAFELSLRYTAVYRRRRGQWQLVSWQSTTLK